LSIFHFFSRIQIQILILILTLRSIFGHWIHVIWTKNLPFKNRISRFLSLIGSLTVLFIHQTFLIHFKKSSENETVDFILHRGIIFMSISIFTTLEKHLKTGKDQETDGNDMKWYDI
jgi:hypothetical protein